MHPARQQLPFIAAALLLCAAVVLMFPYCGYYVDPDATAYLTIARRYAEGDIARAINGYWSPLTCWLTALGIKAGWEAFRSAIFVNALGALGFLWISNSFFRRFGLQQMLVWWLNAALAVFLAAAVYVQSFADLWQCFLLLCALRLMLTEGFRSRPLYWFAYGLLGTLAYFAKAYSFPFFILNTCCLGFFVMNARERAGRTRWLQMCAISLFTMILCSSPWIYLLHEKYGVWMTSTAGKLNMSWYLVGHPYYRDDISFFLPPVYEDSPYYWEDPWMSNGETPRFWSSGRLFLLQWVKLGYNALKLNNALNHFSAFALPMWGLAVLIIFIRKIKTHFPADTALIAGSLLLFPIGFLLINFEPRYIWYTWPLTLLIGALALQLVLPLLGKKLWKRLLVAAFALSFMAGPISDLYPLINEGKAEHALAADLRKMGIRGSFASNATDVKDERRMIRLAYFSGNPYYLAPSNKSCISREQLVEELQRNGIRYYFHFPRQRMNEDLFRLEDSDGRPFPHRRVGGATVFILH
jgi:hypothetical protein